MYHVFEGSASDYYKLGMCYLPILKQVEGVGTILKSVDPLLNDQILYQRMINCADLVKYQMAIGSTIASGPVP